MIRFGVIVSVVVAAVGLLVVGAVAGDLTLVYVSIALAAAALLLLIVGVAVWRDEVFASSARRDERDLATVGAVGHAGRGANGPGAVEDWPDRPAARPGPAPAAGFGLQGGDTREFSISVGALPDRDAPAERHRRSGESRPTEQLPRPADPAARPGREVQHRERTGREAGSEDWPGRDLAAPDFSSREAATPGSPGRDLAAAGRAGRDAAAPDRPGRDAMPGDRPARETAAVDRAARETASAHRPDRVGRYPTVTGSEGYESADDPTRLAHRLDSLADFGRQADPNPPGSPGTRAGRPGGPRLPAAAPIDPLTGEWTPGAEPVAAAPSTGRPTARPTRTDQGPGADADAPQPSRAVSPTPVAASTAPGATAPGTTRDLGSRSPVPPAEPGHDRQQGGQDPSDLAAADSPAGALSWPHGSARADAPPPAEAAATAAAGLVFPAPPAGTPAARDEDPATATRAAAAPSAAAADAVGAAVRSEPDAWVGTGPAEPAKAAAATDGGAAAGPAIGMDDQVSVVPGIARYHKADCILIRFLSEDDLEVVSRRDAEAAGSAPCRACRPERPPASD
jgi:hypothetical protein